MNKKRIQQIKCLFTLFFVVCASFYATRSYAQNNAVTIRLSGVSMERVMNEIENQTNYLFLSNKDVDINSVVSVDVEARPLSEALAQMVRGTDVVYRFDGKYILLSKADRRPVTVKGVVTNITDFGLFVEVEEGIEGLVHVSELSSKKIKSPAELYKEGQEIQAKVIHVSAEERRLGLSIKQIKDDEDRRKPKEFHAGPQEAGQSLGDLLKAAQENN